MRGYLVAAVLCLASVLPGCGGVYYTVSVNAAQARVEQAREMGAESAAPYEYYYAREHLREAQLHAAEASYGDAATYAETAETYAQKAIDLIQSAKRGEAQK
jgi:major membrane immunogen (membrane-anchored lipoprotein)